MRKSKKKISEKLSFDIEQLKNSLATFLDKEKLHEVVVIPLKEKSQEAEVVALGTGKKDDDGKNIGFQVKKGDIVLISKYGGTEVKLDDVEYQLVREDDILGIIG